MSSLKNEGCEGHSDRTSSEERAADSSITSQLTNNRARALCSDSAECTEEEQRALSKDSLTARNEAVKR